MRRDSENRYSCAFHDSMAAGVDADVTVLSFQR
jgi:hypothetical protein